MDVDYHKPGVSDVPNGARPVYDLRVISYPSCQMTPTQEEFLAELEALGVGLVKDRIASNIYKGDLRKIAQGWVERKETTAKEEPLTLARKAHTAAQTSNKIAILALVIAVISMIGSIAALFKH